MGAGAPLYSLTGQLASGFGMFPNRFAQGQTDIANQADQYRQDLGNRGGVSGFANNLVGQAGEMSTFMPLAYAAGALALEAGAVPYLGSLGTSALVRGGLGGLMATPLMTAMHPTDPNKSFGQSVAENVPSTMGQMALMSGALGAIGVAPGAIKSGAGWVRQRFSAEHAQPLIGVGDVPSVSDVMAQPEVKGRTIPQLQSDAQTGNPQANQILQQVRLAASVEHGQPTVSGNGDVFTQPINLSEADRSGDPIARQNEVQLEGQRGSVGRNARILQGTQINQAIEGLKDTTNNAADPNTGKTLLPPDADTSAIIQDGTQRQFEQNRAEATRRYENMYGAINDRIAESQNSGNPINPEVNPRPAIQKMLEIMEQNKTTLAQDPQLNGILTDYADQIESHLQWPSKSPDMLSVRGIKDAVSNMESQAEGMKAGTNPNRNGARLLSEVTRLFDQAADNKAIEILGSDTQVKGASQYYKDNVVPFLDHDSGLPQIREGAYPDKATKAFLSTASPDQFKTLVDNLPDPQVRQALKSKILEAATDQATNNRTSQLDPQSWASFLAKRGSELPSLYDNPSELHHIQSLVDLAQNTPRAGEVAPTPSILQMGARNAATKGLSSLTGALLGGPAGAIAAPILEEGAEIGINRVQSRNAFVPDFNDTAQRIGLTKAQITSSNSPAPRSLGAAGMPAAQAGANFQSPGANPEFTMEGRAGTGQTDPYANLRSAQEAHAAAQGETAFSKDNLGNAIVEKRRLTNETTQAKEEARQAFETAGGTKPMGWGQVDRDAQHQAFDQNGNVVESYDPNELPDRDIMAGTSTNEDRLFMKDVLGGVNRQAGMRGNVVREPSPEEMDDVASRIGNWMDYLQKRGISGKEEVLLPNNVPPRYMAGSRDAFASMPSEFHPGSTAELQAEYDGMAQTQQNIRDFADRTRRGELPVSGVQTMDQINDLSAKTSRVRDLQQQLKDMANSPINTKSLQGELADAQQQEFEAFQNVRRLAVNQRLPVPANYPNTQIPTTSLSGQFTEPGQIYNPRNQIQTATRGILPQQSLSTMSEPYVTPQSGQGPSSFGPGSVGAGYNPLGGAQSELDRALTALRAKQAGTIPAQAPTSQPTLEEAQNTFNQVNSELTETPIQKATRELAEAQTQMRQTGIKADEAAKALAARRLNEGLAETPPNSPYDKPEQAVPVDPQGPLSKLKAWAQVHGFLPPQAAPIAPQTPIPAAYRPQPEPQGNPQSHTLTTAKGSLNELMQNLSRLQQQANPTPQGPYQNPIWAAQHPLPSRIELSEHPIDMATGKPVDSDVNELARQMEIERPDLIDLRDLRLGFGNVEPPSPSTGEVFKAGNAALKQMGAEPSVQPELKGSTTDRGFAMTAYQDYVQQTTAKQLEYAKQLADAKQLGASAGQIRQMQIDQNKHLADRKAAAQKMLPHVQKGNDEEFNKLWQGRP
jgi:hypothetical protein